MGAGDGTNAEGDVANGIDFESLGLSEALELFEILRPVADLLLDVDYKVAATLIQQSPEVAKRLCELFRAEYTYANVALALRDPIIELGGEAGLLWPTNQPTSSQQSNSRPTLVRS
jgi:hypothetical protein